MAVLQIAQFTLEIFICPYHISFVVAMYAVVVAKDLFRYGLNTPPISFFEITTWRNPNFLGLEAIAHSCQSSVKGEEKRWAPC